MRNPIYALFRITFTAKWLRLAAIALGLTVAAANAAEYKYWAHIDEIQVFSDFENGNEYSYAKVYFTPEGQTTQQGWVLPLQKNGADYTGAKYLESVLQQAAAGNNKVYLHSVDSWGLGAQSYFSLFEIPRIRRVILYK